MKTHEDVERLKKNWLNDPCWDLTTTNGFEEYYLELSEFQDKMNDKWAVEREGRKDYRRSPKAFDDWMEQSDESPANVALLAIANALQRQTVALERIAAVLEEQADRVHTPHRGGQL